MARTEAFFYRDARGRIPLLEWLDGLPSRARAKCIARIDRLAQLGNDLRRPEADYLRDGIYELRASFQGIHYRVLYFFLGRAIVILSHGLIKQREVPRREIALALERRRQVETDFQRYTFKPGVTDEG